jgi:hypothetical protein
MQISSVCIPWNVPHKGTGATKYREKQIFNKGRIPKGQQGFLEDLMYWGSVSVSAGGPTFTGRELITRWLWGVAHHIRSGFIKPLMFLSRRFYRTPTFNQIDKAIYRFQCRNTSLVKTLFLRRNVLEFERAGLLTKKIYLRFWTY